MRAELEARAAAAVVAAGRLTADAEPGPKSRALTLADHGEVLQALERSTVSGLTAPANGVVASAAHLVGSSVPCLRRRHPRAGTVGDLHRALVGALSEVSPAVLSGARAALKDDVGTCGAAEGTRLAQLAELRPGRNRIKRAAERTAEALSELAGALELHRRELRYPMSPLTVLADIAVVLAPLMSVVTYLEVVMRQEAQLIEWLYQDVGLDARAARVTEQLDDTGARLHRANERLRPVSMVLRDIDEEEA